MLQQGYAPATAIAPAKNLTSTQTFQDILDEYLPEIELAGVHKGLLRASRIDHMVFADGPKNEKQCAAFIAERNAKLKPDDSAYTRDDILTDDDIRVMLEEKNCAVRRISRTENSRHVYFWSSDNKARASALEMAYKLRGSFAPDKHIHVGFSLQALGTARTPQLASAPAAIALPPAVQTGLDVEE